MKKTRVRPLIAMAAFGSLAALPAFAEAITPIADVKRGQAVTVEGTVERILDEDEFRLEDASGRIDVYIGPNVLPANTGDRVTVRGIVDDDSSREIYARQLVMPDGSVVTFDNGAEELWCSSDKHGRKQRNGVRETRLSSAKGSVSVDAWSFGANPVST